MMKDLIRAIESGGVSRKEDLAARAGMEVSTMEGAIDFLVKRGYLTIKDDAPATGECNCSHCGVKGHCVSQGVTYVLTEKGKKMAHGEASP